MMRRDSAVCGVAFMVSRAVYATRAHAIHVRGFPPLQRPFSGSGLVHGGEADHDNHQKRDGAPEEHDGEVGAVELAVAAQEPQHASRTFLLVAFEPAAPYDFNDSTQ
jgi:hypothetical protein